MRSLALPHPQFGRQHRLLAPTFVKKARRARLLVLGQDLHHDGVEVWQRRIPHAGARIGWFRSWRNGSRRWRSANHKPLLALRTFDAFPGVIDRNADRQFTARAGSLSRHEEALPYLHGSCGVWERQIVWPEIAGRQSKSAEFHMPRTKIGPVHETAA